MCGIVGCWLANADSSVCQLIYDALIMLQHRGQGACGELKTPPSRPARALLAHYTHRESLLRRAATTPSFPHPRPCIHSLPRTDAAGIVTVRDTKLSLRKGNGLVRDVFEQVRTRLRVLP